MIRDVDLVSYLPPFMAGYKEVALTLRAEDPEFILAWEAADRVLKNEFIDTADDYGVTRLEKLLGIVPSKQDTIEIRRKRVSSRWFTKLPYTWRMLLERLTLLCGEDFIVSVPVMGDYGIEVSVSIGAQEGALVREVQQMLENSLPLNLIYRVLGVTEERKEIQLHIGTTMGRGYTVTTLPEIRPGCDMRHTERISAAGMGDIMETILPGILGDEEDGI